MPCMMTTASPTARTIRKLEPISKALILESVKKLGAMIQEIRTVMIRKVMGLRTLPGSPKMTRREPRTALIARG